MLRVLPLGQKHNEPISHVSISDTYYYPLKLNRIESISILLCDENGREIKFKHGRIHLVMHFRRAHFLYKDYNTWSQ